MYCENCGNNYTENDKFCIKCGNPVNGQVSATNRESEAQNDRRWHRLAAVIYVLAHLPLLAVVFVVWSENSTQYSYYTKTYRDTSGEAFWYCLVTIFFWLLTLRLIKMAARYVAKGTKPRFRDLLRF